MFMNDENKRHGQAIKIARETTNNQKKEYNSVKHLQRKQFSFTKRSIKVLSKNPVCDKRRLQTCRPADLQTCRLEDLQTHIFCDRALLCLLLANRKVCLRQTAALAGCKHDSARFDRWLEILAVEDLTSEERWPNFSESSKEEDGWDNRAALYPGLYSGMTSVSRE